MKTSDSEFIKRFEMKTNDSELKISKYNRDGRGVAFQYGRRRIVDGVLKGETVKIDESGEVEVVVPSPFRRAVGCKNFSKCGGCNFLFAEYEEQLRIKKAIVAESLSGVVEESLIGDAAGMYYPFKYRNKIHLAISEPSKGAVKIGFFEENSKRVINFEDCLLHSKSAEILTEILREFIIKHKMKIYGSSRDGLRYAAARFIDDGIMLTIVSTYAALPNSDELLAELSKHFREVSLYLNLNRLENSMIFSDKFIHLGGKTSISGKLCGIKFEYYPSAFIQINDLVAAKIYNDVLNNSDIDGETTVLDIYSGIGVTSALFAKRCAKVYSVELSKDAVKAAAALKKANGLSDKIINICGDAGAELTKLSADIDDDRQEIKAINTIRGKNFEANIVRNDELRETEVKNKSLKPNDGKPEYLSAQAVNKNLVVFADPPRVGLDEKVIKSILRLKPKQIIYLSCNPKTLNDNLKKFLPNYSVASVTPYDMFPQTRHVETLVVLNKKDL